MRFAGILSLFLSLVWVVLSITAGAWPGWAQARGQAPSTSSLTAHTGDTVVIRMQQAYSKRDQVALAELLPQAHGHLLEPWAAYWELKARLEDADAAEVHLFLQRWAGTYQEDRLRNDWLLLQGQRQNWDLFDLEYRNFRMQDDPELRCYKVAGDLAQGAPLMPAAIAGVLHDWTQQKRLDHGCLYAAEQLYRAGLVEPEQIWRKARLAMEAADVASARAAAGIITPVAGVQVAALQQDAAGFLARLASNNALGDVDHELAVLALVRLGRQDADRAASVLRVGWAQRLRPAERNWLWGVVGKWSAVDLSTNALAYFAQAENYADLDDDLLQWQVRAALRAGAWPTVLQASAAMSDLMADDGAWAYWQARAQLERAGGDADLAQAEAGFARVAAQSGERGFYQKLAQEALGHAIDAPPVPPMPDAAEQAWAQTHPGLQRALYAISIGLRREGVREWNYWVNLHEPGGMSDRQRLAAAQLACAQAVWDRCINTSERTRGFVALAQRYPTPFRDAVLAQSQRTGLDAAYVYGLIRQESRFILAARSHAGATGLMQLMPDTARWTARQIGLQDFSLAQTNDLQTNILLGTSYLKLALDDFQGSLPLAAAAYNAGPRHPASWRNGPELEGAIWVENIPFWETRDYVKKVLANTTDYAVLLSGQPQSLRARLGVVGPLPAGTADPSRELP